MTITKIWELLRSGRLEALYDELKNKNKEEVFYFLAESLDENINLEDETILTELDKMMFYIDDSGFLDAIIDTRASLSEDINLSEIDATAWDGLKVFQLLSEKAPEQLYRFAMDGQKQKERPNVSSNLKVIDEFLIISNKKTAERSVTEQDEYVNFCETKINERKHDSGVLAWEIREPGSIAGVLNAYQVGVTIAQDPSKKITPESIINMHFECMKNTHLWGDISRIPSRFRESITTPRLFGLNYKTTTLKGIVDLIDQRRGTDLYKPLVFIMGDNKKYKEITGPILTQFKSIYKKEFYIVGYGFKGNAYQSEPLKSLNAYVTERLDFFYTNIAASVTREEKLFHIIKLVQDLERIHPFDDGNCRTFCLVLLNTLLMQHKFPPAIIDDPNKFDGYSVAELVTLVKKGMADTISLAEAINVDENVREKWAIPASYRNILVKWGTNLVQKIMSPVISNVVNVAVENPVTDSQHSLDNPSLSMKEKLKKITDSVDEDRPISFEP